MNDYRYIYKKLNNVTEFRWRLFNVWLGIEPWIQSMFTTNSLFSCDWLLCDPPSFIYVHIERILL